VPESKKRKKAVYTAPPPPGGVKKKGPSPVWLAPLMLALFLIGITWLVVFYLVGDQMPLVGKLGNSNLLIGFGFIIAGFGLSTQWR
jgi:hypothetical protein